MGIFIKSVEGLSRFLGYVAAALLVVAVVIVCHMVIARFGFNEPTSWQTEFVTYTLLASTFLGAPWVLLTRGHVNVELVPLMLGPRGRFALALFAYGTATVLCVVITWYSVLFWHEAWEGDWASDTIWGPKLWKAYAAMPVGFFAISLQYIAQFLCLITGREPPFGIAPDEDLSHHAHPDTLEAD
ncbi:MAG: TRAP transporter small permease [Gammaproteobacteria bacterium]